MVKKVIITAAAVGGTGKLMDLGADRLKALPAVQENLKILPIPADRRPDVYRILRLGVQAIVTVLALGRFG